MSRRRRLTQVHSLKVSHHGSHNGTPLDKLDLLFDPASGRITTTGWPAAGPEPA